MRCCCRPREAERGTVKGHLRRALYLLPADERPAHQPVSLEVRHGIHVKGSSVHLPAARNRRRRRASCDLHGRPAHPDPATLIATGGDTRLGAGKATRWSSTRWATTTSSGLTLRARRTAKSCTPSSGGRASATARWSTTSLSRIPKPSAKPVQLRYVARVVKPGVELMEYICAENNQIGIAGGYLGRADASQIGIGGGPVLKDEKK